MSLPVAILAGGLGTRLGGLTQHRPKALVDVAGKPFIHHQLDLLRSAGLRRIVVCAGHLGKLIEDEMKQVKDMDILVLQDWPQPLGTAGAIRAATPYLGNAFFVLYGDSYLPCDYQKIAAEFLKFNYPAMMVVCEDETHPNAQLTGIYISYYNKNRRTPYMHHIDYGLSVFRSSAIANSHEEDLADLFHRAANDRWLLGYEWPERYFSIGSLEGLAETDAFLRSRKP